MAERYGMAASRHFEAADALMRQNHVDDAGYHFGMAGENIVKHALQEAGLEAFWTNSGRAPRQTPMRGHFPTLRDLLRSTRVEVQANCSGRLQHAVQAALLQPAVDQFFDGWSINIRYADDTCTPVQIEVCQAWRRQAEQLIGQLLL